MKIITLTTYLGLASSVFASQSTWAASPDPSQPNVICQGYVQNPNTNAWSAVQGSTNFLDQHASASVPFVSNTTLELASFQQTGTAGNFVGYRGDLSLLISNSRTSGSSPVTFQVILAFGATNSPNDTYVQTIDEESRFHNTSPFGQIDLYAHYALISCMVNDGNTTGTLVYPDTSVMPNPLEYPVSF